MNETITISRDALEQIAALALAGANALQEARRTALPRLLLTSPEAATAFTQATNQVAESVAQIVVDLELVGVRANGTHTALTLSPAELAAQYAGRAYTASDVLQMPAEERDAIMLAAAERMAPYYEADLTLPVEERELTLIAGVHENE